MDFTLALAHFCEVHGPTSILCTQLSPVDCGACFPVVTTPPTAEDSSRDSSYSGYSSDHGGSFFDDAPTTTLPLSAGHAPLLSPFDSPPTSPRSSVSNASSSYNPYFPDHNHQPQQHSAMAAATATARRTRGSRSSVTSGFSMGSESEDTESCDNCMFLVPKAMSERLPDGAPGSPIKDGRGQHGSPVLRTTHPILARGGASAAAVDAFERRQRDKSRERIEVSTPDHDEIPDPLTAASTPSTASDTSSSSQHYAPGVSSTPGSHTHMHTYVTTKQPLSQSSYSFLRRACIRTLSNETLPKGSPSGPLYFGDPHAGYTIAYVFRVPDPRARGRRRMYALLALGGRDSWRVSKVYVKLTRVFEAIAAQIIAMADRVIESEFSPSPTVAHPSDANAAPLTPPLLSTSLPHSEPHSPASSHRDPRTAKSATTSPTIASPSSSSSSKYTRFNNTSSFLTGKRIDPDGHPRLPQEAMKAKSLAEIVGNDGFFVELHVKFCVVLHTLAKEFA